MPSEPAPTQGWRTALAAYRQGPVRSMLGLGFSSGLPLPLVLTTLSAWLKLSGVNRASIGHFAWVGLAYSLKYFWAPLIDRLPAPLFASLGRRRGWLLTAQCAVLLALVWLAGADPAVNPEHVAMLAVFAAFCGATQDIVVDAYRIEAAEPQYQGSMAAAYQIGYQLALISAGAGALALAADFGWALAYYATAAQLLIGIAVTLSIAEPRFAIDRATLAQEQRVIDFIEGSAHWPKPLQNAAAWLIGAVVCPFADFFQRNGWRSGVPILLLIITYRMNYTTMGVMANPFYLDLGFTLKQIAVVSKVYGVFMTLLGALTAGVLVASLGIPRALLLGCTLIGAANFVFAYIAGIHPGVFELAAAISIDNLANGIAGAAFIAYMSSLTNTAYTATQYALFGTLWTLPAKLLAGFSGNLVELWGYRGFFVYTAALSLPALLLILRMPASREEDRAMS